MDWLSIDLRAVLLPPRNNDMEATTMPSIAPICVPCGYVMKCSKTGRFVLEHTEEGEPYAVHSGDEFECPECRTRVVTGFARSPVAEAHQRDFERWLNTRLTLSVNPYRRWVDGQHTRDPLPCDPDLAGGPFPTSKLRQVMAILENRGNDDTECMQALCELLGITDEDQNV